MESTIVDSAKRMQDELDNCGKIPMFEIPVLDKRKPQSNELEGDIISCNIYFNGDVIEATHIALNNDELNSIKIASTAVKVDSDHSLDEHLQALYLAIIEKITNSDIYYLI